MKFWAINLLHACIKIAIPGLGIAKPISSVPLCSEISSIIKAHITNWISRLYLTVVAAAEL